MTLKPNVGSDRSWVYTAHDYSEGEPTTELLAVRFANAENAQEFKAKFAQAQKINTELSSGPAPKEEEEEEEKAGQRKKPSPRRKSPRRRMENKSRRPVASEAVEWERSVYPLLPIINKAICKKDTS